VAFTAAQREALGLIGRLPAAVLTLEQQAQRACEQLQRQGNDLAKNVHLEQLHDGNEVLYYKVLAGHLAELLPAAYDLTVGEAIDKYSHEYRRPRDVFLSIDQSDVSINGSREWQRRAGADPSIRGAAAWPVWAARLRKGSL